MARIFFSVSGEGRGHAARARTIVEALRDRHEFTLFSYGMAYDFLAGAYRESSDVEVRRIPGMEFRYTGQQLDYFKSVLGAIPFMLNQRKPVDDLATAIRRERVDLVVTDFEPLLPRAAERCGVPYVSLDHQHFLVVNDLSSLPWPLRWRAWLMGLSVPHFYRRQAKTIVSSFYAPPVKASARNVVQTGVLLRNEILRAKPTDGGRLLAYMRRFENPALIETLANCGLPVRLYGLGVRPPVGGVEFREIDERTFVEDLVSCRALVSSAGNQLVGEALYLKKPVLAIPERGNFEQAVNAHFLKQMACGDWVADEAFGPASLTRFLARLDEFRERIVPDRFAGNVPALAALEEFLPRREALVPARQAA